MFSYYWYPIKPNSRHMWIDLWMDNRQREKWEKKFYFWWKDWGVVQKDFIKKI